MFVTRLIFYSRYFYGWQWHPVTNRVLYGTNENMSVESNWSFHSHSNVADGVLKKVVENRNSLKKGLTEFPRNVDDFTYF